MSPPRCGFTTVVVPFSTWSPVNSDALLLEEEAQVVRRVTGSVQRLEPELGAVDRRAVVEHEVELQVELVGLRCLAEPGDQRAGLFADPRAPPASDRDACA